MNIREEINALEGHIHTGLLKLLHALLTQVEGQPAETAPPAEEVPIVEPVVEPVVEPEPAVDAGMSVVAESGVGEPTVTVTEGP